MSCVNWSVARDYFGPHSRRWRNRSGRTGQDEYGLETGSCALLLEAMQEIVGRSTCGYSGEIIIDNENV